MRWFLEIKKANTQFHQSVQFIHMRKKKCCFYCITESLLRIPNASVEWHKQIDKTIAKQVDNILTTNCSVNSMITFNRITHGVFCTTNQMQFCASNCKLKKTAFPYTHFTMSIARFNCKREIFIRAICEINCTGKSKISMKSKSNQIKSVPWLFCKSFQVPTVSFVSSILCHSFFIISK